MRETLLPAAVPLTALLGESALLSGGACAPVVALVGAGGKTTLLYALARALTAQGLRIITTTTTHIFPPSVTDSPCCLLAPDRDTLREALGRHGQVTVARAALPDGKLAGFAPEAVQDLAGEGVDYVLVEADGAAMRPLKAPAAHEPAVPPCAGLCVALCGLRGVGHPMNEVVHRPELAAALCHCSTTTPVQARHLAVLTLHPQGLFRTCLPRTRRAVLCVLAPEGFVEQAMALAAEVACAGRTFFPAETAHTLWWAGSPAQGWVHPLFCL